VLLQKRSRTYRADDDRVGKAQGSFGVHRVCLLEGKSKASVLRSRKDRKVRLQMPKGALVFLQELDGGSLHSKFGARCKKSRLASLFRPMIHV